MTDMPWTAILYIVSIGTYAELLSEVNVQYSTTLENMV
jgi:hypothetical protein